MTAREAFYGEGPNAALVTKGQIIEGPPGLKYPWLEAVVEKPAPAPAAKSKAEEGPKPAAKG